MVFPMDPAHVQSKQKHDQVADTTSVAGSSTEPRIDIPDESDNEDKGNSMFDAASPRHLLEEDPTKQNWVRGRKGTRFFVNLISCLYFLVLTIFALMVEISPIWQNDIWIPETIFFMFMYGTGILFLFYCYIFMVYPHAWNFVVGLMSHFRFFRNHERWMIRKPTHMIEGAGTLYLRLGAMFFGCIGIVLFGFEIFLCVENYHCKGSLIAKHILAIIFTFVQMHFIFCNNKIAILGSRNFAKFGVMHLISVNLWTWFRGALAKQAYKANKKKAPVMDSSSSSSSEEEMMSMGHGFLSEVVNQTIEAVLNSSSQSETSVGGATTTADPRLNFINHNPPRLYTLDHFGGLATFLTTCIVEYSILGAAVMFIIWGNIDQKSDPHGHGGHSHGPAKRKYNMNVNCSNSSSGLFAGIVFLIAVLVMMGVATMFSELENPKGEELVYGIVDISLFAIALAACIFGLWRMRLLQWRLHAHGEIIDEILLVIGFIGELAYCVIGIDMFIASWRHEKYGYASIFPIFVFCTRLMQTVVQTAFIFTSARLRCLNEYSKKYQPGKQVVTFLIMVNIALFAFHVFESTMTMFGIHYEVSDAYMTIIYAIGPLLVFYRFHSSAFLAEIWKHTYNTKSHGHHDGHGHDDGHGHGHHGDGGEAGHGHSHGSHGGHHEGGHVNHAMEHDETEDHAHQHGVTAKRAARSASRSTLAISEDPTDEEVTSSGTSCSSSGSSSSFTSSESENEVVVVPKRKRKTGKSFK